MHIHLMAATISKAGGMASQPANGLKFHIQLFQLKQVALTEARAWQAALCGVNKKVTD